MMVIENEREEALRMAKEAGVSNQTKDTIEPTIRLIRLARATKPAAPAVSVEPVAHMYPSDLEMFKTSETFAHAYSIAVGNPDESSIPLYTAAQLAAHGAEQFLAGQRSVLEGEPFRYWHQITSDFMPNYLCEFWTTNGKLPPIGNPKDAFPPVPLYRLKDRNHA